MDIEPTQALQLSDFEDDDDVDQTANGKEVVGRLTVLAQKNYSEAVHEIFPGKNLVGRQADKCSIALPDSKTLSKEHACIEVQGDSHLIYDLGSRNKTKRGKMYLTPDVRYELKDEDRLTFADMLCVYHIGSGNYVEDSGSETGSESMLIADTQAFPGKDAANVSNFLQPTQQYVGLVPRLLTDAPTQNFVDSYTDDCISPPTVPFSNKKSSVMETPLPNQKGRTGVSKGGMDISVVPESGDEGTPMSSRNTSVNQTLLYADDDDETTDDEAQEEEAMKKIVAADMATQAYVERASDSEPDNATGGCEGFDGPTQMFPALSTRGEDLVATQAYGENVNNSKVADEDATQPFDDTAEVVGDVSLSQAPTQTFDADIPNLTDGTMAIQDSEEEQDPVKNDKKPAKKVVWDDATQVIGDAVDSDAATQMVDGEGATQALDDTDAETQVVSADEPTQMIDTDGPTQKIDPNAATQVMDPDSATQAIDPDAATQAIDPDAATQAIDPDAATQAIGPDAATQPIDPDAATQAIDPNAATQEVYADADAATQALDQDATMPLDDAPVRGRGSRGRRGRGRGRAQVASTKEVQMSGTQKSQSPSPTRTSPANKSPSSSKKKSRFSDEPTQVIPEVGPDDATQAMVDHTDSPKTPKSALKVTYAEDATQVLNDDDLTDSPNIPDFTAPVGKKQNATSSNALTQAVTDDEATQQLSEDATQTMAENVSQPVADDATQPMEHDSADDATQPMGDDETQPMDTGTTGGENETVDPSNADIEPTQAYGMDIDDDHVPEVAAGPSATKDLEPTQAYGDLEPTQAYEDDEASPALTDSLPLIGEGAAKAEPATSKDETDAKTAKRGRRPARKNDKNVEKQTSASEVKEKTDMQASSQEESEDLARNSPTRSKSPAPDNSATKSGGRGRRKGNTQAAKAKESETTEQESSTEKTTVRRRGRRKASASPTPEDVKIEEQSKEGPPAEETKANVTKLPTRGRGRKSKTKQNDEPAQDEVEASTSAIGAVDEGNSEADGPAVSTPKDVKNEERSKEGPSAEETKANVTKLPTRGRGRKSKTKQNDEPAQDEVEASTSAIGAVDEGNSEADGPAVSTPKDVKNEERSKEGPSAEETKANVTKLPTRGRGRKSKTKQNDEPAQDEVEASTSAIGAVDEGNSEADGPAVSKKVTFDIGQQESSSPTRTTETEPTRVSARGRKKQVAKVAEAQDAADSTTDTTEEKSNTRRRGRAKGSSASKTDENSNQEESGKSEQEEPATAETKVKKPTGRGRGRRTKEEEDNSEQKVEAAETATAAYGDDEPTQAYEDEAGPSGSIANEPEVSTSAVKDEPISPPSSQTEEPPSAAMSKKTKETKAKPKGKRGRAAKVAEVLVKEEVKEEEMEEEPSAKKSRSGAQQSDKENSTGRGRGRNAKNKAADKESSSPAPGVRNTRGKIKENRMEDDESASVAGSQGSSRSSRRSAVKDKESDLESTQSSQEVESNSRRGRRSTPKEEPVATSRSRSKRSLPEDGASEVKEETPEVQKTPQRGGRRSLKKDREENQDVLETSQSSDSGRKQSGGRGGAAVKVEEAAAETPKGGRRKRPAPEAAEGAKSSKQKKTDAAEEPDDTPSEAPDTPSLRKRSIIRVPKVMFTGVIDEERMKIMQDLGGVSVDSIYECTHLITDQVRRTVKFLCGVARGIYVVDVTWLNRCKDANTFIDAKPFVVKDPANESKFGFSLSTSLDAANNKPMLEGYSIHATKGVKPPPDSIKDIVKCAGAQYLTSMPKKKADNLVIISCEADEKSCAGAIKLGIPVVSAEFILTGILRQELDIESFQLFNSKAPKQAAVTETTTSKRKRR